MVSAGFNTILKHMIFGVILQSNFISHTAGHGHSTQTWLYALPDDFPGYEAAKAIGEPYARVAALETDRKSVV